MVVWNDDHAFVYVGHKVHHSPVPLEQLRQKSVNRPLFKVKVYFLVVHGTVRLHWGQLIWACVRLESQLRITDAFLCLKVGLVKHSKLRNEVVLLKWVGRITISKDINDWTLVNHLLGTFLSI